MAQNKTDLFIDILTRDKTKGGIKSAEGGLKTFTKNAAKLGGAYAGVAAITTKTFQTMEDAQAQVANVLGKSTKEIRQQYTSNIKAIANETGQPLEVVWRNLYDVVSAGNEGADAFAVLRQAGKLAFAGNADYTSSTKLLLNTMVDQKVELKDLDKVSRNYFAGITSGRVNADDMNTIVARSGAVARSSGLDFKDLAVTVSTFSEQGISAGETATQLNDFLKEIAKGGSKEFVNAIAKGGYSVDDLSKAMGEEGLVGVSRILNDVQDKTNNN